MDIEKIIDDLNRRFAAPLPDYYRRRIIFWHDEEGEFADKVEEVQLANAKVLILTGSNTFAAKKLLNRDDLASNYLVYDPRSFDDLEKDWLLDIELCNEEFRADLLSIWMDELGLPTGPAMRKTVKQYRKFLNAKERRAKIAGQKRTPVHPGQLHLAVMAAVCGVTDAEPERILQAVLTAGLYEGGNDLWQELERYEATGSFWGLARQETGYQEEAPSLGHLAIHLLLSAASRTMNLEDLAGLERYYSVAHQAYCYDLVSDWLHSDRREDFRRIARYVEDEMQLFARFEQVHPEGLMETECFPCINEILLKHLMEAVCDQTIDENAIVSAVEKRRTCAWYDRVSDFYEGLLQLGNMLTFFKEHAAGFHAAQARDIWRSYTSDYCRMDSCYRQFHVCFQHSLEQSNLLLDDLFKQVADKVEGLYSHWYLDGLSANWSDICAEELAEHGKILEVPEQKDFYRKYIQHSDSRVYVIISDALRYEVATTLAEELQRDMQSQVKLEGVQGIFPTITKFGMAALLPHKELTAEVKNDQLQVLADGQSTASTNREQVLRGANPNSVALQYKNIIGLKRAERSALVKGMDVVYIYHDTIDEASHHSDTAVFPACEKAIAEIKNLIKIITSDFGRANILITSDHGFLYTYRPLQEFDKVDKTSFQGKDVEYGRRYAIMEAGAQPAYLTPVKFLEGTSGLEGFAPRENIRIKMSGSGMNFVHGGISLQEMVVPVIEYHHLRNDSAEYKRNRQKYDTKPVTLQLLSASRKVSNMIFHLSFFQKDAVGSNREAATYRIYFEDAGGKQISDVQKIIADKTNENPQERTFRGTFNLKSLKYDSHATYYLVIADEKGLQMPQRVEFQIDIAFAMDDFNFFS